MSRINNLLDKISKAIGPDRTIDSEVAHILGWKVYNFSISGPWVDAPNHYGMLTPTLNSNSTHMECPHWSSSIDECDRLFKYLFVNWRRSLYNCAYDNGVYLGDGVESATIYHPSSLNQTLNWSGYANSGPLAYLSAILLALQDNKGLINDL